MFLNCKIKFFLNGVFWLLLFASFYYLGLFFREKNLFIYNDGNWRIVMDKKTFPDCLGTKLYLKTFYSLHEDIKNKDVLISEIERKMEDEKIKLQKRRRYSSKKERKNIDQNLNYNVAR